MSRIPNRCYTWVQADHGVEVHKEEWVGSRAADGGWPARTECGIEYSSASSRRRSTAIPRNLAPCPRCLPGLVGKRR